MEKKSLSEMTEEELRAYKVGYPEHIGDVNDIIIELLERTHTYGTCVYAMSIAAEAVFNYVAGQIGVTGFQASCADLDFIRRTRHMEMFRITNIEHLMFPQYCNEDHYPTWQDLIKQNAKWLKEEAQRNLETDPAAHPEVIRHWQWLANLEIKEEGA